MEDNKGPEAINIKPNTIKTAQEEMGRLDVLLCGQCHSVFHFVEDLQQHRSTENACSKVSNFRENNNMEQKAQVWAFLLWKDTQMQSDSPDKDATSWKLYQKWCGLDSHTRDTWIIAGKTIQTFTKISNTNMLDVPQGSITTESGKTVFIRKVTRNGQPDSWKVKLKSERNENPSKLKLKPSKISPEKTKFDDATGNMMETDGEEYAVEKILAKRFNPKKKVYEYLLKWEGYAHEHNSWEEVSQVSQTCKRLMEEFEKNLAKQKEDKAMQLIKIGESNKKAIKDSPKPGPSSASGRPMRSSKSKAMDQVKQWCGSMTASESQALGKRKIHFSESDSDDGGIPGMGSRKRNKVDSSGDEWTADSDDDKIVIGQSDVIQRAFRGATGQSNGSNRNSMTGAELNNKVIANKGLMKVDHKSGVSQQSNVYIVHRKDGVIRLDSPPTNKIAVKGQTQTVMVQNRDGTIVRKQIVTGSTPNNSVTPVKVVTKPDGSQVVTQMKVITKSVPAKTVGATTIKTEPVKIQPKPDSNQIQQILVTSLPSTIATGQSSRLATQNSAAKPNIQRSSEGTRPLLPRPTTNMRTSTPNASPMTNTSISKTPLGAGSPSAQRQILTQKRPSTTTTIQVTSSPNAMTAARPKITVTNQQGKPVGSSPAQGMAKALPRTQLPSTKSLQTTSAKVAEQKMIAARRKVAEQAGVVPRLGQKIPATKAAQNRSKSGLAASGANKQKDMFADTGSGLHMEFHQVESGESDEGDSGVPPASAESTQQPQPESPQFTLCPLTGRIIGPDGLPIDPTEPESQTAPEPTPVTIVQAPVPAAQINADGTITTPIQGETAELVLPSLEGLADSTGGMVRVEMSPGGTTGMIVQTSEETPVLTNMIVPGPDLPCLDDPSVEIIPTSAANAQVSVAVSEAPASSADGTVETSSANAPAATLIVTTADSNVTSGAEVASTTEAEKTITGQEVTATNVKMEEHGGVVTITGDDGVLYQVTGQAEDGQTLLVTRAGDGEQQCVYVTTADQQAGEEGQTVLTLDNAVAEAVAQFIPDQANGTAQYYVKQDGDTTTEAVEGASTDNQQVVMSIMDGSNAFVAAAPNAEDADSSAQVVAQVIQADEPTPGGTRRVVLLLPDGNLMMTEVDEEQYAALELDK